MDINLSLIANNKNNCKATLIEERSFLNFKNKIKIWVLKFLE
jgi:hypothetical protein